MVVAENGGKSAPLFKIPQTTLGKVVLGVVAILVLAGVLILGVLFSSFLGTRVIGYQGPRTSVRQGEKVSLLMPNKVGLMGRKVEICRKNLFKVVCSRLDLRISKNAKMVDVQIPQNYRIGSADLRMIGIFGDGKQILLGARGIVVLPSISANQQGGGSGGGSNGGGSSDSGSSGSVSTSTPTPPLPYGPYGI